MDHRTMPPPPTLLDAAAHPDPYPHYAALRDAHRASGVFRDTATGLWVACTAAAVADALAHPALHVRPVAEPVPSALAGRPIGRVFGGLMRMNEGAERHAAPKADVLPRLAALLDRVPAAAARAVNAGASPALRALDDLLFDAPLITLALASGLAPDDAATVAAQVRRLVAAWSPTADEPLRAAGDDAALALLHRFAGDANRIGWYTQAHDATGGLLGNTLLAWRRVPAPVDESFVAAASHADPAVHHTRRWAAEATTLRGHALAAGDGVLVLLASAEHDGEAGAVWGAGRHACPGAALSRRIVAALLARWTADAAGALRAARHTGWRPLPNTRIPTFAAGTAA